MGDNNTYNINDDGSVTVAQQLSEQEQDILDILRIEKSKGGIFASRRMKKRALKYAKSVNYPELKIEKLMLDNYPDDFTNYPKTTKSIILICVALLFFGGAVSFSFPAYYEYEYASYYNHNINDIERYLQSGCDEEYHFQEYYYNYNDKSDWSITDWNNALKKEKFYRNSNLIDMGWWLFGAVSCVAVCFFSIKGFKRIASTINLTTDNKSVKQ